MALFCVLLLVLPTIIAGFNYTCMSCTDAARPYTCNTISHCGPHEICYVETYKTTIGTLRYNQRCQDDALCEASVVGRKRETTILCAQCCHGDLCNLAGCGEAPQGDLGPVCYDCDSSIGVDGCEKVRQCGRDQVCSITSKIQFGISSPLYATGCTHKSSSQCHLSNDTMSNSNIPCGYCCDTNLCNAVDPCKVPVTPIVTMSSPTTLNATLPTTIVPSMTITTTEASTDFCLSNGHRYIQDQTWIVGCDLQCTCNDSKNGRYSCGSVCLNWDTLPSTCSLEDPAPGMCCQQPRCPAGVIITVPVAYKDQYPGYTYV